MFFGYFPLKPEKGGFLIAEPEKAILDTFYLFPQLKDKLDLESLRLNYAEIKAVCDIEKLKRYTQVFDNQRVTKITKLLISNLEND